MADLNTNFAEQEQLHILLFYYIFYIPVDMNNYFVNLQNNFMFMRLYLLI
jgi:hypothetical protein